MTTIGIGNAFHGSCPHWCVNVCMNGRMRGLWKALCGARTVLEKHFISAVYFLEICILDFP